MSVFRVACRPLLLLALVGLACASAISAERQLEAIFVSTSSASALVGGELYREGDRLADGRVAEIRSGELILVTEDGAFSIPVGAAISMRVPALVDALCRASPHRRRPGPAGETVLEAKADEVAEPAVVAMAAVRPDNDSPVQTVMPQHAPSSQATVLAAPHSVRSTPRKPIVPGGATPCRRLPRVSIDRTTFPCTQP